MAAREMSFQGIDNPNGLLKLLSSSRDRASIPLKKRLGAKVCGRGNNYGLPKSRIKEGRRPTRGYK